MKKGRPTNKIKRDMIFALIKKGWKNKDILIETRMSSQALNYYKKLSTSGLAIKNNKN